MQLLDVRLTGIQRRNRAVLVPRSVPRDGGALTVGQQVVLRDERGEYFAGTVVDADHERYLLHLGVRLPEEYAFLRVGRRGRGPTDGELQTQQLLDLLGDARDTLAGTLPPQRRTR